MLSWILEMFELRIVISSYVFFFFLCNIGNNNIDDDCIVGNDLVFKILVIWFFL